MTHSDWSLTTVDLAPMNIKYRWRICNKEQNTQAAILFFCLLILEAERSDNRNVAEHRYSLFDMHMLILLVMCDLFLNGTKGIAGDTESKYLCSSLSKQMNLLLS